jgi:polyphosphate kinase
MFSINLIMVFLSKDFKNPFINRELSWLKFNLRVLEEAENLKNPILERIRFLAISDSNLDEFFMVRVASLHDKLEAGIDSCSPDGLSLQEQLEYIYAESREFVLKQEKLWGKITEELKKHSIYILNSNELSDNEKMWLEKYFATEIFPALTPLAIDPAHPLPLIPNDSFSMALQLSNNKAKKISALITIPQNLQRFISIQAKDSKFLPIEEAIKIFLDKLFPGFRIDSHGLFHLIRNSEMEIDDELDDMDDFVEVFKTALKERKRGDVIRLMVQDDMDASLLEFLLGQLNVESNEVFLVSGLMNFSDLSQFCKLNRPELIFPKYKARYPERIRSFDDDCFEAIRNKDLLIHHPYESFDVVVDFLKQAAKDPNVLVIKQTLYRTSVESPIVKALCEASEKGKSVTAVVELKARFDEQANIDFARELEKAGVQVVFGFVDLKTHAKISLVVRREGTRINNYVHFGTGNYHPLTAKIYTDLSFFTCDPALAQDAAKVFNYLTGYAEPKDLEKLKISPINLEKTLIECIEREIENAKNNLSAEIWAKMNSLVDPGIIEALYNASKAGVKIRLIVRGVCCLRPGVKDLSENISVKSIVGRFLEHSRIICFANGKPLGSEKSLVFISSADWMQRNFYKRVETLVPIENETVKKQILDQIMMANLRDDTQSWDLASDKTYTRLKGNSFSAQEFFMTNRSLSGRGKNRKKQS